MKKNSPRIRRNPAAQQGPHVEVRFDGPLLTNWGGAPLLREFGDRLGLAPALGQLTYNRSGRTYQGADYLFAAVQALLLGCQRQSEIAALRHDPATLLALGLPGMPSQGSFSRCFAAVSPDLAGEVLQLSARLGRRVRASRRYATTLDLDGQIVSTRGHPEGADYGYNPKRRGAKSYFASYGFLGETREMLTAALDSGRHATVSGKQAVALYQQTRAAVGGGLRQWRLRADAGFARFALVRQLQQDRVMYFICWPRRGYLKALVENLEYQRLDDKWAWAETRVEVPDGRPHRLVVRRERLEPDEKDKRETPLLDCPRYAYHLVVTNARWSGLRVLRFYDHRSCLENIIKENQEDFGGNHVICKHLAGNRLWQALSVLAYNVMNWFRERILRQRRHRHTARWIRRTFLALPAKVVHSGRRWYLRVWRAHPIREAWLQAWQRVQAFSP